MICAGLVVVRERFAGARVVRLAALLLFAERLLAVRLAADLLVVLRAVDLLAVLRAVDLLAVRALLTRLAVVAFLCAAGTEYCRTSSPPIDVINREALFACLYTLDEYVWQRGVFVPRTQPL